MAAYDIAMAELQNAQQAYNDMWQRAPFSDDEIEREAEDARLIAELERKVEDARVAESADAQAGGDNEGGGGGDEIDGFETESDDDDGDVQVGNDTEEVVRASSPLSQNGETTCNDDAEETRSHTTEVSYDYDFGSASEEEEDAPCCSDAVKSPKKRPRRGDSKGSGCSSSKSSKPCDGSDCDDAGQTTTKKRPRRGDSKGSKQSSGGSDGEDEDGDDDNKEQSRQEAIRHYQDRWCAQPPDQWYELEMKADAARAYGSSYDD
jgi:hypothetical protein